MIADETATVVQQPSRQCILYQVGLLSYPVALEWQRSLVAERIRCPSLDDVLILVEHPPVYTLGQAASLKFLKFDPQKTGRQVYRVERGGEVTYHCPGCLIAYPIFNLRYHRQDLHWYLRQLEEVIIRVLAIYGLKGERLSGLTGVWLQERKVAAIGIKVSRWITMHGFALNVCPNLDGFDAIVPCGISNKSVCSLVQFLPEIDMSNVRWQVASAFAEVFGLSLIKAQAEFKVATENVVSSTSI